MFKKKIILIFPFIAAIVLAFIGIKMSDNRVSRPNIILILLDDNSAETLSCYGGQLIQTPNLDRIATDGIRFDSCFSDKSGKMANLPENNYVRYSQLLHDDGFQTGYIGKWVFECSLHEFDFASFLVNSNEYINPFFLENGKKFRENGFVTDIFIQKAITFLKNRDFKKPFALTFYLNATDSNCIPAPRHSVGLPDVEISKSRENMHNLDTGTNECNYLKSLLSVDENMGRLVQFLQDTGDLDHTIIVYSSNKAFKTTLNGSKIRIPLLVRYPQIIMPNTISNVYCSNTDIFPTILDFAGIKSSTEINGKTLKPILELSKVSPEKLTSNGFLSQNELKLQ